MRKFSEIVLNAELGKTHLFSVGQAGFIIKTKSGKLIGYDLYLSDCVYRLERKNGLQRMLPQILESQEIQFDYLVASHAHRDHFDEDSLPQMMHNSHTKLFASISCENDTKKLNISQSQCSYVKPNDSYSCDNFEFHFVHCDHGIGAPDAVGLVLIVDEKKIYFTGDTCLRIDTIPFFQKFGKIDVMIAPINGAWGNLNEVECAKLSAALNPKITIPCHYGMFAMHGGNPNVFASIMKENYPQNDFLILQQGEELIL